MLFQAVQVRAYEVQEPGSRSSLRLSGTFTATVIAVLARDAAATTPSAASERMSAETPSAAAATAAPMTYLARWRLTIAGDLLLDPTKTVAEVARAIGYEDPFAFSSAFRRRTGLTPTEYRRRTPRLA